MAKLGENGTTKWSAVIHFHIWCKETKIKLNRKLPGKTENNETSEYNAISAAPIQVITWVIPIDLLIEQRKNLDERGVIHHKSKVQRSEIVQKWQYTGQWII